ncbi:MAG TPA: hypothetical protein VJU86_08795 [Pyrinomonadaceae bacterium]|nr:hypothetical protein [Pyrinomonadaceae bacterium]
MKQLTFILVLVGILNAFKQDNVTNQPLQYTTPRTAKPSVLPAQWATSVDPELPRRFPTPTYSPASFIRRPVNARVIVVRAGRGEDLATLLNAVQNTSTPRRTSTSAAAPITVRIEGGGSIKSPVRLRHHTVFDSSQYSCDVAGYRCFTVDDNVLVEGTWRPHPALERFFANPSFRLLREVQALTPEQMAGMGTTILEPTYADAGGRPAIEVFMTHQNSISLQNETEARGITILGFHIKGRQRACDGGVRQTITLGNCVGCAAIGNYLEKTGSIGIQLGGNSVKGFRAKNYLVYRNVSTGLPAAHIAVVNGEDGITAENYIFRAGGGRCGGGISGYDLETNVHGDWAKGNWVIGNVFDYEGSEFGQSAGNAINLNDPGRTPEKNGDNSAVNNWIFGARRRDTKLIYMSSCMMVSNLNRTTIAGNYCFKTAQTGLSWYGQPSTSGQGSVVEENVWDSTGGGGGPTMFLRETAGITIRRNKFYKDPHDLKNDTDFRIWDCAGRGNSAIGNLFRGQEIRLTREGCR